MAIYAILAREVNPLLEEKIKRDFQEDYYSLSDREWLVSSNKIAKAISDDLEISEGKSGHILVLSVNSYFGWWNKTIWEWLKLKEAK